MHEMKAVASYRMQQWAEIIQERVTSGETIEVYYARIGITKNAYYYWLRKLRRTASEVMAEKEPNGLSVRGFSEVKLADPALTLPVSPEAQHQVCIETNGIRIIAGGGYPAGKLLEILRTAVRPC